MSELCALDIIYIFNYCYFLGSRSEIFLTYSLSLRLRCFWVCDELRNPIQAHIMLMTRRSQIWIFWYIHAVLFCVCVCVAINLIPININTKRDDWWLSWLMTLSIRFCLVGYFSALAVQLSLLLISLRELITIDLFFLLLSAHLIKVEL